MRKVGAVFVRKKRNNEEGTVAVIVALLMTAILTVTALVADLGSAYLAGEELQTAADAAVLAAGVMLPVSCGDASRQAVIQAEAMTYFEKNTKLQPETTEIYFGNEFDGKYRSVGIKARYVDQTSFARIIGVNEIPMEKEAEAKIAVCTTLNDVVPLSVRETTLADCLATGQREHIVLKFGAGSGAQGNYGAIDLDGVKGGGANDYRNWLENGYEGELTIGDKLYPVESGNMAGPTYTAFTARYNACQHYASVGGCTKDHYVSDCPRVVKVPVVEFVDNQYAKMVGFAAFVLEDTTYYKKDAWVTGSYVDMVNVGSHGADMTDTAGDYGVYSVMLSK